LDSAEAATKSVREGASQRRLARAWDVLDEHVTTGDHCGDSELDRSSAAQDDLLDGGDQRTGIIVGSRRPGHRRRGHGHASKIDITVVFDAN
jgi:hypothetical protein